VPPSDEQLAYTRLAMKILVDSAEYRCWHEVGHATVCLHLGGAVELIEFLDGDARGHARARCIVLPEMERTVACGGFAAEFYLLNGKHAEQTADDTRNINDVVFHNATHDREDFWGRKLGSDETFTDAEDRAFMNHSIGPDGRSGVLPILYLYHSGMQQLVHELREKRRIDGRRVNELLRHAHIR